MNLKSVLLTMILSIGLLVVVIDYIYLQQKTRNKFVKLQELIEQEHDLNANWGRLQIEHSTFVNNSRIEETAKNKLGMKLPDKEQIISIKR